MSDDGGRGLTALVALIGIGAFAGFAFFGVTSWGRANQRSNCGELADFIAPRADIVRDEVAAASASPETWRENSADIASLFGSLRADLANPKLYRPDDPKVKALAAELAARLVDYRSAVAELDGTLTGEDLLLVEAGRVEQALDDVRSFCAE